MAIPAEARGKFYALRVLALVLVVISGLVFFLWPNSFGIRSLGLIGIMVGAWLVRRSNAHVWRARGQVVAEWSLAKRLRRVGDLAWILAASSFVACVVFYIAMYVDQAHGGKELWPVYAFGAAAIALTVTSGYVAMRVFG